MLLNSKMSILSQLRRENVPLQHSVKLLCKADGIELGDLALKSGCHRIHLYRSLSGLVSPSERIRNQVNQHLGLDPWEYQTSGGEVFSGDPEVIDRILTLCQNAGVPLQYTVCMLCKSMGIAMGKLANECGYHRAQLYLSLTGAHRPSTKLRQGVEKRLGLDPWNYSPDLEIAS